MKHWLITGGSGFIGINTALALEKCNIEVTILDDLSRDGSAVNCEILRSRQHANIEIMSISDTNRFLEWSQSSPKFDVILHLAAQVSLMASIRDPRRDFEVNCVGTVNVLEAMRQNWPTSRLIFASTNKVYGDLSHLKIAEAPTRYVLEDAPNGINENERLDFHGGYSCSKGAADQYVLDYNRIYGLDTIVLRQSAICGRYQNPSADQGWASFLIRETLAERAIQLYGEGKQVRDLLDVEDLVDLYLRIGQQSVLERRVFNVGGGRGRDISLLELFSSLEERGFKTSFSTGEFRPSDQMVFVADLSAIVEETGWSPRYELEEVIERLILAEQNRNQPGGV